MPGIKLEENFFKEKGENNKLLISCQRYSYINIEIMLLQ